MEERENIRERLKKHKLSYVWLIGQLALRGIVTDKTEMSSVISGTRNGTKADAIIELSIPPLMFWVILSWLLLHSSTVASLSRKWTRFWLRMQRSPTKSTVLSTWKSAISRPSPRT